MEALEVQEEKALVIPPIHQSIPSTDPKDYLTVTQRCMTKFFSHGDVYHEVTSLKFSCKEFLLK